MKEYEKQVELRTYDDDNDALFTYSSDDDDDDQNHDHHDHHDDHDDDNDDDDNEDDDDDDDDDDEEDIDDHHHDNDHHDHHDDDISHGVRTSTDASSEESELANEERASRRPLWQENRFSTMQYSPLISSYPRAYSLRNFHQVGDSLQLYHSITSNQHISFINQPVNFVHRVSESQPAASSYNQSNLQTHQPLDQFGLSAVPSTHPVTLTNPAYMSAGPFTLTAPASQPGIHAYNPWYPPVSVMYFSVSGNQYLHTPYLSNIPTNPPLVQFDQSVTPLAHSVTNYTNQEYMSTLTAPASQTGIYPFPSVGSTGSCCVLECLW